MVLYLVSLGALALRALRIVRWVPLTAVVLIVGLVPIVRPLPELVELGCFIALTMGQQSWLRLLNIEHHQVLAGTDASMAPGFSDAAELSKSKASNEYWAKSTPRNKAAQT